jgi:hypothetical protein
MREGERKWKKKQGRVKKESSYEDSSKREGIERKGGKEIRGGWRKKRKKTIGKRERKKAKILNFFAKNSCKQGNKIILFLYVHSSGSILNFRYENGFHKHLSRN